MTARATEAKLNPYEGIRFFIVDHGTPIGWGKDCEVLTVTDDQSVFDKNRAWVTQKTWDKIKELLK